MMHHSRGIELYETQKNKTEKKNNNNITYQKRAHNLNGVLIKIMVSKCEAKDCRSVINATIIGELIANV